LANKVYIKNYNTKVIRIQQSHDLLGAQVKFDKALEKNWPSFATVCQPYINPLQIMTKFLANNYDFMSNKG